jgi:hypothetical protein
MATSPGGEGKQTVGSVVHLPDRGDALPLDVDKPYSSWGRHRWHLDRPVLWPLALKEFDDVPRLFRDHVIRGYAPAEPLLTPEDTVVTIGSCFANELRRVLDIAGFGTSGLWVPSGLNNTFALLDFLSWCVTGEATPAGHRYERGEDGEIREWTPREERETYRANLERAGAFVFTLGLSEVWIDRTTGLVFWRGVPEHVFDADRHLFRRSTVEENVANLSRIVGLIRSVNPDAPIVLTLSPVPLAATFGDTSVVAADCVSKSTLRVAIESVVAEPNGVHYWPSFELIKWGGPVFDYRAMFVDSRHPLPYLVYCILDAFVEAYYGPACASELRARVKAAEPSMRRRPRRRVDTARIRRAPRGLVRRGRKLAGALRTTLAARSST